MGFFRKFSHAIKTIASGGRDASMIMDDSKHALVIIKRKLIRALLSVFKKASLYILIASVIIVAVVAMAAVVFEIFSASVYGDTSLMASVDPRDMKEWSDSLSDEDIETMKNYGSSVHPRKIYRYALIEDESYPKNVNIKIPQYTRTWGDDGGSSRTDYLSYEYLRGDNSYPYRQWWHSTAILDIAHESAEKEDDLAIIDSAKDELAPIYVWSDPMTESYVENSHYNRTSEKEEETIKTTTVQVVTSGEGSTSTKTNHTEVKTYKPLPFLNNVTTMFSNVTFDYKPINESNTIVDVSSRTYTVTRKEERVNSEGLVEEHDVDYTYTETTTTTTVVEFNSWEIISESNEYIETFMSFLNNNKIDTKSDPYMMYLMAETMPQNYDFLNSYGEYLTYMDLFLESYGYGGQVGEYTGDFGEFEGGEFIWPVPSHQYVTSHYGYRTHPVTGKRGSFHGGVDLRAPMGVDIVAASKGIVSFVGPKGTYGNLVILNHGGGITTYYAHNSRLLVSPGQSVEQGEVIALAGSTGRSKGSHLHFEVRKNNKSVDPLAWLRR